MQRFAGTIAFLILLVLANHRAGAEGLSDTRQSVDENGAAPVAGSAWSDLIQPPMPGDDTRIRIRFAAYREALTAKAYSEAEIAAKQMVEDAAAAGLDSSQRIRALHNLAVAQQVGGNYDSALQNYVASLELIAEHDNNLSPNLILPLRGFASTLMASGRPNEGYAALERAQHVSHVNFGPHSLDQLPILQSKMQHHLAQGDSGSAVDVLDAIFVLYTRRYDRYSEQMLPALYERADVFRRLKMHWEERVAWERILDIKNKHLEDNDLELIEPHVRLAHILMRGMRKDAFRSVTASDAEKHLKRALRIARNSPDRNWTVTSECLLSLADFYTIFDMKGRARRYYADAWQLLSSVDEYRSARDRNFASPVPLARPRSGTFVNVLSRADDDSADRGKVLEGELTLAFTVDDRGRTRDVRLHSADPANFSDIESRAARAAETFIYRPRYVDGHPVDTPDQRFRFRFSYREPPDAGAGQRDESR